MGPGEEGIAHLGDGNKCVLFNDKPYFFTELSYGSLAVRLPWFHFSSRTHHPADSQSGPFFTEEHFKTPLIVSKGIDHDNVEHLPRLTMANLGRARYCGDDYTEVVMIEQPGVRRITLGVISLVAAAALAAGLATQISDQVIHGAFVPAEYFSYFTIQTSLANLVALIASGLFALQSARDTMTLALVRQSLFGYAIVTGLVYNLLLRGLPDEPGAFVSEFTFPNEIMHVVMPIYFAIEWLINPYRPKLPNWSILVGVVYPVVWAIGALVRGHFAGWYPYDFLDPSGPTGWAGVWLHIGAIAALIIALMSVALTSNRLWARLTRD